MSKEDILDCLIYALFFIAILGFGSFAGAEVIKPQTYRYDGKCKEIKDYIDDLKFTKSVDQNISGYPFFWDVKINIVSFNVVKEENNYCYVIIKYN